MSKSTLKIFFFFSLLVYSMTSSSQTLNLVNRDTVYVDHIASVQLYNPLLPLEMPVINLNSNNVLKLSFDDFLEDIENYYIFIEHCNYDWSKSELSPLEYNDGFDEDLIDDYEYSETFYDLYNHYNYTFPNNNLRPTKTGNYLLHVYLSDGKKTPVFTQRFFVYQPLLFVQPNYQFPKRHQRNTDVQEIDFKIEIGQSKLSNPMTNIKVDIYQNGRTDIPITGIKPNFGGLGELKFDYLDKIIFPATREYRFFDTRSTRVASAGVEKIFESDEDLVAILNLDESREKNGYFYIDDLNGSFTINSFNKTGNPEITAEYVTVIFTYKSAFEKHGKEVHLYGKLTNWSINENSKMTYSYQNNCYYKELKLKQGYYDYAYSIIDENETDSNLQEAEGNKFETENDYYYFVYYRSPIDRYDQILGYLPHKKIHYE